MSEERIKELEQQVESHAEAAFVARKLLGEALYQLKPEAAIGKGSLHVPEDILKWQDVTRLARKRVLEYLHLGRMKAKADKDAELVRSFEAAIEALDA